MIQEQHVQPMMFNINRYSLVNIISLLLLHHIPMCASPHTCMDIHLCPSACTGTCTCTRTHTKATAKAVTAVFTASQTGINISTTHMHRYTELVYTYRQIVLGDRLAPHRKTGHA